MKRFTFARAEQERQDNNEQTGRIFPLFLLFLLCKELRSGGLRIEFNSWLDRIKRTIYHGSRSIEDEAGLIGLRQQRQRNHKE